MSPGRKPSRSPASTAGLVRITRLTSPRESAAAAIATARKVLPVPAGPIPKVTVCRRMESTYCFWLTVLGATGVAVLPDDVLEDLGRALVLVESTVTASIVPGAISCPCSIRSTSSPTTVSAVGDSVRVAVQGEDVAAEVEVDIEMALEHPEDGVLRTGQLGRDTVVDGELPASH